jgi:lipopolysaccharide/colanic/teichoic acid biosynthesis glycosyltransferase
MKIYRQIVKPVADFLVALFGLVLSLPLWLPIMLALAIANRGAIFFVQQRPGKNEKPFYIIKFKTMNDARDASGNLLPDHLRLTAVGRFVRKTSLDELPQLINVLKGDISLVGPRPLLMKYLPLYNATQRRRHEVKPGITGWAQVNGRNAISWPQKFALDIYYIDNMSFWLDCKILWLTVLKVFKSEGINQPGQATMEEFRGES